MTEQDETQQAHEAPREQRAPSFLTRVKKLGARLALVSCVLLVALLAFTQTSAFRSILRQQIIEATNASLEGHVDIEAIEGDLFTGVTARGVWVYDPDDRVAAYVEEATAHYSLTSLVNMHLEISEVELVRPVGIMRYDRDGALNLLELIPPSQEEPQDPTPFGLSIAAITVKDAHLVYVDDRELSARSPDAQAGIDALVEFLEDDKAAADKDLTTKLTALMRACEAATPGPVPGAAVVSGVEVSQTTFSLDKQGVMRVRLGVAAADLDANTWVRPQHAALEALDVTLGPDALRVTASKIALAGEDGLRDLALGVNMTPGADKDAPATIDEFFVSAPSVRVSRDLILQVAPTLDIRDGVQVEVKVAGTPAQAKFMARGNLLDRPSKFHVWATASALLDQLMAGTLSFTEANERRPGYALKAKLTDFEPGALIPDLPTMSLNAFASVEGEGVTLDSASVNVNATATDSRAMGWELEDAELSASFADKKLVVLPSQVRTPYADATLEANADLDGEFDARAKLAATDRHTRQVNIPGLGVIGQQRIDATLTAKGKLDSTQPDSTQMLQRAAIVADWDITEFLAPGPVEVEQSTGHVTLDVTSPNERQRDIELTCDIEATRARAPGVDIGLADVDGQARARVDVPLEDPMSALSTLFAKFDVELERASVFGAHIGALDATLSVEPGRGSRLDYTVDGEAKAVRYPAAGVRLDAGTADLSGSVEIDTEDGEIEELSSRGTATVRGLDAAGNKINRANIKLDVKGRPPTLSGKVDARAAGIDAAGQKFDEVDLSATIQPDLSFEADATVKNEDREPQDLRVEASGKLSSSLDQIDDLEAKIFNNKKSEDEPIWTITDATITSKGNTLEFENVKLANDDQFISIQGAYRTSGNQDLAVQARNIDIGQLRDELALGEFIPPMRGVVETIDLELSGTASRPAIKIDVIVRRFFYEGYGPFDLVLKGRYKNNKLTLNTLELDGYDIELVRMQARLPVTLDLHGTFDMRWTEPIIATIMINSIDLGALSRRVEQLSDYKLEGKFGGGGIINGTLSAPMLDMNLSFQDLFFEGKIDEQPLTITNLSARAHLAYEPPKDKEKGFQLDATVQRGERKFVELDLSSPLPLAQWAYRIIERGEEVDFTREILNQPYSMDVDFATIDLGVLNRSGLISEPTISGVFDLDLEGAGTFNAPSLTVNTTAKGLSVRGDVTDQRVDFRDIDLTSALNISPVVGARGGITWEASANVGGEPLVNTNMRVAAPLGKWLEKAARGEELDYIDELLSKELALKLDVNKLDLGDLAIAPLLSDSDAAGVIDVALDASGTLGDPSATLELTVGRMECGSGKPCDGFGWDRYRDVVVEAKLELEDKLLTLDDLEINWDNLDIILARGSIPLPIDTLLAGEPLADEAFNFLIDVKPLPLTKFSAIDYSFASLTGEIAGRMSLSGTSRAPIVDGRLTFDKVKLGAKRKSEGKFQLDLGVQDNIVSAGLVLSSDGERVLNIGGHARVLTDLVELVAGADPLDIPLTQRRATAKMTMVDDVSLEARTKDGRPLDLTQALPMRMLKSYARDIEGLLTMDVDISGQYDDLHPAGKIALEGAALTLPSFGRRFEDIDIITTLGPAQITLEKMSLREQNSTVVMQGELTHENFSPRGVTAQMRAQDFNVGDFIDMPFFATGDVVVVGNLKATPMEFDIDMSKIDVQLTENITSGLHPLAMSEDIIIVNGRGATVNAGNQIDVASAEAQQSSSDLLDFNLRARVKMAPDTWVRHPYGEVRVQGDMSARMLGSSVTVGGQVEALEGQAEFMGKAFTVEKAVISFTGADPPDPRLQIEASYPLDRSITESVGPASDGKPNILVSITGVSTDPSLKLLSDPAMSENDILYVLATNRPPDQADVGQGSAVGEAVASAVSGFLLDLVKSELSDTLPLDFFDVLRVDTTNLEVGKYINQGKIYLAYRYLFGSSNASIYSFQYNFLQRWTLETQVSTSDDDTQLNFNVFWNAL